MNKFYAKINLYQKGRNDQVPPGIIRIAVAQANEIYVAQFETQLTISEDTTIQGIASTGPIEPLIEAMRHVELAEYYERAQDPEYDMDLNPLERLIHVDVNVDQSYLNRRGISLAEEAKFQERLKYVSEVLSKPEDMMVCLIMKGTKYVF
ncbi:hypothetical protein HN587_07310 [Candidatus Woesearchaeota archaeon]|jgi:hypothetical protein|nr:hypothetical protein [Candidatus Woesearchaeota archaeon]